MVNKLNLATMEIDRLIKLREEIGVVLSSKAAELKKQLQNLESGEWTGSKKGRPADGHSLKGVKLSPKYRDTKDPSLIWAGRGARPRWMQERIKAGAKQEDFLIARPTRAMASRKKSTRGKSRKH